MATERQQRQRLDALLKAMEPAVRRAFLEAIQRQRKAINLADLIRLLEERQTQAALDMLRANQVFAFPLTEAVRASFIAGGKLAGENLPVKIRATFGFGFNPRAESWARDLSSRMIEAVDDNLPQVQALIETAARDGVPPARTALDIVGRLDKISGKRTGGILGLDSNSTGYVISARAELTRLDARYFTRTRRDKRFDRTVRKAIETGKPLSQADIDRITARYKDRLLELRGQRIARTETLNALRAGQHEGFQQLIDSGAVEARRLTIKWLATRDARTRDAHVTLGDTVIRFGELFQSPTGAVLAYPGDATHGAGAADLVNCRCAPVYRIRRPNEDG